MTNNPFKKILVVDDEESLCEILKYNLEVEGYEVDVAYSAEQALDLNLENYALILLDVMMGQMSGFAMARELKKSEKTADIPIIFCTAKDTEDDMVAGLNLGGDDYISKPFSIREVLVRVKAVLRRSAKSTMSIDHSTIDNANALSQISFNNLYIDLLKMKCFVEGDEISLTKKELEILVLLLQNKGRVLAREEIMSRVWSDEVIVLDRTIDVNITRLRKKIGEYGKYIITRQGYGYGFEV